MTAIVTTYADGVDQRSAAHVNRLGKAFAAMGVGDDSAANDAGTAKLILPIALNLPFAIVSTKLNETMKAVGASTNYTVPSSKLFYVQVITVASAAFIIAPHGGADITITGANASYNAQVGLCLDATDVLKVPAGGSARGILIDFPAVPSAPTRILQEITNLSTYTVPANKRLLLTHAYPTSSASLLNMTVDGVVADQGVAIASATVGAGHDAYIFVPGYLSAGQVLATTSGNYFISGLLYSV